MQNLPYSVFYQSPDGFFVCRTDFNELEQAEEFIASRIFIFDGAKFHFVLKDGKKLIKGEPMQRTEKFYSDSMKFAVEIPLSSLTKSS
ncbi:hypothetical protein [Mucilaginibacter flavus]|uniref:hypothetical protein n=1 Tax=Mucilaginibacter flavus TaxID=931504 RepID=UPI0025B34A49|nr:hypothetical protein [Mucilaginibacter flavus]MDN3584954.1 hypothetical protein [Mucilaginibacter flavus]